MNNIILSKAVLLVSFIFLSGCSSVQVQQISDKEQQEKYVLIDYYAEPVKNFESLSINSKANELCPKGFNILHRNASKEGELGVDHARCVYPGGCEYALEWHIQCADKPRDPFSLFGRF